MKRILYSFLALLVLLAVGLYGFWFFVTESLISEIEEKIKEQYADVDAKVDYQLEKYGFPTRAGVALTHLETQLKDTTGQRALNLVLTGDSFYYVPFVDMLLGTGAVRAEGRTLSLEGRMEDFTLAANEEKTMSKMSQTSLISKEDGFTLEIGSLFGQFNLFSDHLGEVRLSDVDFYVGAEGEDAERLVTFDDVVYRTQLALQKSAVADVTTTFTLKGGTFMNPEKKEAVKVDMLDVDLSVDNAPLAELEAVRKEIIALNTAKNTFSLKEKLNALVDALHTQGFAFQLHKLHISVDNLKAKAALHLALDDALRPVGRLHVNVATESKIGAVLDDETEMSEAGSLAQKFLGGDSDIDAEIVIENGYVLANKMPVMTVPALTHIIELMPATLDGLGLEEGDVDVSSSIPLEPSVQDMPFEPQSYVEPETFSDDLLGHFKE